MSMKKIRFLILAILLFVLVNGSFAQNYYVNTYGDSNDENLRPILIKAINLTSRQITDSVIVANYGYIWLKNPAQITSNGIQVLVTVVENGSYAKNSYMGPNSVIYSVVQAGRDMTIVRRDSINDAIIDCFDQFPGEQTFRLGLARHVDTSYTMILPTGNYGLNDNFDLLRQSIFSPEIYPGRLSNIGEFKYPTRINPQNPRNLYYCLKNYQYWLAHIINNQIVVDSLQLETDLPASAVFAYHPIRDKIYVFHLNYEQHGKFRENDKNYGQNWIAPEVSIYDPNTFQLLESHQIADFDSSNYPLRERGVADVVGNYIVYYFFQDEWLGKFYPAMLFIFDTRTNQATWLRVGWR